MNENVKKWVDALRSDKYKQGQNYLCRVEKDGEKHCCLGVAIEVFAENNPGLVIKKKKWNEEESTSFIALVWAL